MRLSPPSSATLLFLLITSLDAASIWSIDGRPSRPEDLRPASRRTLTTRVRDKLVETVWPARHDATKDIESREKVDAASLPHNLLKRFGSDKVLRFELENDRQRRAIAEAADTLFLDVWGFTKDWVDIRLSKDTQATVFGLLPSDIKWHAIVPDLASAVFQSQNQQD